MMRSWGWCILLWLCSLPAWAQLKVAVDSSNILIGEQVRVTMELRVNPEQKVVWPELGETLTEDLEVVNKSLLDTLPSGDQLLYVQEMLVTSFDSGYYPVPPIEFIVDNDTLLSEAFLISVFAIEVDTAQAIMDIKPPIDVDFSILDWMRTHLSTILWVGIPVLLLIGFLIFWFNRPKQTIVVPRAPPPPPAHTIALDKLRALKDEKLWQEGQYKAYHSRLTEIFREYLENRYAIPALEQTTDEIITGLRSVNLPPGVRDEIKAILSLADLVKFAKVTPLASENELAFQQVENFVRTTARRTEPEATTQP